MRAKEQIGRRGLWILSTIGKVYLQPEHVEKTLRKSEKQRLLPLNEDDSIKSENNKNHSNPKSKHKNNHRINKQNKCEQIVEEEEKIDNDNDHDNVNNNDNVEEEQEQDRSATTLSSNSNNQTVTIHRGQ